MRRPAARRGVGEQVETTSDDPPLSKEPVRSGPATPPELQYVCPAGRQLQRDRHDGTRELAERTAPALLDALDLPALREAVGGRVEGERDRRRLVPQAPHRDRHAPLCRA